MALVMTCFHAGIVMAEPSWTVLENITNARLNSIWGIAEDDIFAVGSGGVVVHYDGSEWSETTLTYRAGISGWVSRDLHGVWGSDVNNVFAVGNNRQVWYYNGSDWLCRHSTLLANPLYGVWGRSPDEVFGVGQLMDLIFRWYNVVYSNTQGAVSNPTTIHNTLYDIWGTGTQTGDDLYAVGNGRIVEYQENKVWQDIDADMTAFPLDDEGTVYLEDTNFRGVWGSSADDVFVVGDAGTIVHYDGSEWSLMESPTTEDLQSVWGTCFHDVYAVGNGGTVIHYNGATWADISDQIPTTENLYDIWGSSSKDIYVVGNNGTVIHYDGTHHYAIWCDPDTNLCWQDPQREAYDYSDEGVRSREAIQYCEELALGGYDDWRVPTIMELRTIIAGNPDVLPDGDCPIDDDCSFLESWDLACQGLGVWEGPGDNGCYLKEGLTGTCDKIDIYSPDHYLEHFALEAANDDPRWVSSVMFELGAVLFNHICTLGDIRCVRDDNGVPPVTCAEPGPCEPGEIRACPCSGYEKPDGFQICADDGSCWGPCECTDFTPDPTITPECDNDVCPDSDTVKLTIIVPGTLPYKPHQLMAFYYDASTWEFPPARPPDGGTYYDQVIDPGMPPYTINIPGCTYYGEYGLEGDYQLYVYLQMDKEFPPIPECGDYWWGDGQDPITFPFDGVSHSGTVALMEIMLESVCGCPPERPHLCAGGYCVADPAECCPEPTIYRCPDGTCVENFADCPTCGDGEPMPDDSEVWSCRYASTFSPVNCVDFPVCEEWPDDEAQITAFCQGLQGADPATLVVTKGNSCRQEFGLTSDGTRCMLTDSGRNFYAYGMPNSSICTLAGGSGFMTGPLCEDYCE